MSQYIYYQGKEYPIPIQYSLPKGINSVEAGLLIDGTIEDEDILSIFYDWDKKGIVKIINNGHTPRIEQATGLPNDAKPYEKYIYYAFFEGIPLFKKQKINLTTAHLLVMDYCFREGWIQDFMPKIKNINRTTKWLAIGIPLFLYILVMAIISVPQLHIHIPSIFAFIFALILQYPFFLLAEFGFFNANKVYNNQFKKNPIKFTDAGTKLAAELLGYKKYLDQIKISCKCDKDKENILMKYGNADQNIALKIDSTLNTINFLKKYTYTNVRALWKYYNIIKVLYRSNTFEYDPFDYMYENFIDDIAR